MKARFPLILLTAAVLAGCAGQSPRERDTEAYELYRDFAGAPIDEFTYLGNYDGWRSLGKNVLAVQTGMRDAYLITVQGPCSELSFANTIALTSTGNTVRRGLDSVRVGGDELHDQGNPPGGLRRAAKGATRGCSSRASAARADCADRLGLTGHPAAWPITASIHVASVRVRSPRTSTSVRPDRAGTWKE